MRADRRLQRHVEHLPRNEAAQFLHELATAALGAGAVHDHRERIDFLAIDEHVELDEIGRAVFLEFVVERGIAARHGLQAVEEVHHHFVHRQLEDGVHLAAVVAQVDLHAALLVAQGEHGAEVVLRHEDVRGDDGFADLFDLARIGQARGVFDALHLARAQHHFIDDRRRRGDEVLAELALEPLLHDVHVQQPQEAAAKAESQRLRGLGLELQRRVVQLELFERLAQGIVFARLHRIEAGEDLRFDLAEAGQRLGGGAGQGGDRVADLGGAQFLDAGHHEAHFATLERVALERARRKDAEPLDRIFGPGRHQADALAAGEPPVDHAHQHDDADVVVEPGIDDERAGGRVGPATRRRHPAHHGFEHLFDAQPRLGRAQHGFARIHADDVFDLGARAFRIGLRQVDLVEHRHHLDTELDGGVAVGHRLRLHPLGSVDHQQRPLAGRQRAAHLVGEIDVPRGVDEVELVGLAVARPVAERGGLRLDGDAALALEIHRVEHAILHLALGQAAAILDEPIGERRLAMVDVGDDREVAYVFHRQTKKAPQGSEERQGRFIGIILTENGINRHELLPHRSDGGTAPRCRAARPESPGRSARARPDPHRHPV